MALKPPSKYSRAVRQTLHWLVADEWVERPLDSEGESRYLLCHAARLHESFRSLPMAGENERCLVVGSWGLEVPYLVDKLGWRDVTCLCAPTRSLNRSVVRTRKHPNRETTYEFTLLEHDIEKGTLPFEDGSFGLVVFWGCFEHLRHDPEYALYEINRVCAPDATISLVTDNAISFQATHSLLRGEPMPNRLHWPSSEGHWRLYSPQEIRQLLEGTGWSVDVLTSIVSDPDVYWKWWKRWMFKRFVSNFRKGFGLDEPFWNAFILANARKVAQPTRAYPTWLYKDEKIRQLKIWMMELVSREKPTVLSA